LSNNAASELPEIPAVFGQWNSDRYSLAEGQSRVKNI